MTDLEDDGHAQRRELSRERWTAHKDLHAAEKELGAQKWQAHVEQHASIARNLAEYKAQSNEWRGSLADLRSTFASVSSVEGLESQMRSTLAEVNRRIDTEREERRDQQNLRVGAVDTWKWIAGFLGLGGVSVIVYALLNAAPQ